MTDFFVDDFFTELDLVEDPLGATDLPVDIAPSDAVAGPEWYSELWFTDLDPGLPDVGAAMSGLPLPDPFQAGAGVGVAGTIGRKLAVAQLADTSVSLAQKVAGLRRRGRQASARPSRGASQSASTSIGAPK